MIKTDVGHVTKYTCQLLDFRFNSLMSDDDAVSHTEVNNSSIASTINHYIIFTLCWKS